MKIKVFATLLLFLISLSIFSQNLTKDSYFLLDNSNAYAFNDGYLYYGLGYQYIIPQGVASDIANSGNGSIGIIGYQWLTGDDFVSSYRAYMSSNFVDYEEKDSITAQYSSFSMRLGFDVGIGDVLPIIIGADAGWSLLLIEENEKLKKSNHFVYGFKLYTDIMPMLSIGVNYNRSLSDYNYIGIFITINVMKL